jgi:hypothetical protein
VDLSPDFIATREARQTMCCASQFDPAAQTRVDRGPVHKFAAVIDIQRAKGKGKRDAHALKCFYNEAAFAHD